MDEHAPRAKDHTGHRAEDCVVTSRMSAAAVTNEAMEKRDPGTCSHTTVADATVIQHDLSPYLEAHMPSLSCLSQTPSCFALHGPQWSHETPQRPFTNMESPKPPSLDRSPICSQ